jgi:hypothetical protein
MDSSLADAADLARAALREHAAGGAPMRVDPAYRHPLRFAVLAAILLAPTFVVVGLSIVGHELGVTPVASVVDGWLAWVNRVRVVDLALVSLPLVAFVLAVLPLLDLRVERVDGAPALALRVRALGTNLFVATIALLVGVALVAHIVVESVLRLGA